MSNMAAAWKSSCRPPKRKYEEMNRSAILTAALAAVACAASVSVAKPRVTVEAEAAVEVSAPIVLVRKESPPANVKFAAGASGDAYLAIPQGVGNPPDNPNGSATLKIDIPADDNYTLWCRVWWLDECGNSFTIKIDDETPFLFGEDATFKTWHWVRYPVARTAKPLYLTKGTHQITFLNREDGVCLDQVILSADKRFVPVGVEKAGIIAK